jgi:hypothetical protein
MSKGHLAWATWNGKSIRDVGTGESDLSKVWKRGDDGSERATRFQQARGPLLDVATGRRALRAAAQFVHIEKQAGCFRFFLHLLGPGLGSGPGGRRGRFGFHAGNLSKLDANQYISLANNKLVSIHIIRKKLRRSDLRLYANRFKESKACFTVSAMPQK